ncbi:MAG: DUF4250 domain-containing protein [Acholeplasmatales bacterium]|nr:DUF4250 domain-containing protein [Acholeplasmatales bacterium]
MINNPVILLSIINTKLRDFYNNLDDLCDDLDYEKEEVINILSSIGYYYNIEENQFKEK